jgi:aryl carrier-like protein
MAEHLNVLASCVADALLVDPSAVDTGQSFIAHGGDSLSALYVTEELAERQLDLKMADLLEDEPLARIALGITRVG